MRIDTAYIARIAGMLRDQMGDDFDEQAFMDTLEGETDALELADYLLEMRQEASAMADMIRGREAALALRRKRYEDRSRAAKKALGDLMDAIGVRKIERPAGTISRTRGMPRVVIEDEAEIPSQLCRIVRKPDIDAIKAQLESGETVPGARLETGPEGLAVRSR